MIPTVPRSLLPALILTTGLAAQAPTSLASIFPTPIHTAPDDPIHGAYGHWASGADYKVSFGHAVTFYPWLGRGHAEHRPWTWDTASVSRGAHTTQLDDTAGIEWNTTRWELHHAGMTERWDVRAEGVEQSFVFAQIPRGAGDLVIRGTVTGPLQATHREPADASILFRDADDRPLVEFGRAVAFDATGQRIAVPSSWDGTTLGLHVPGTWLEHAVAPITVDPLIARSNIGYAAFGSAGVLDSDAVTAITRDDPHSMCHVFSRLFTDGDVDAFGVMRDADFGNATTIWQDTATFETLRPRCSFSNPSDEWVFAFERRSGTTSSVRAYRHPRSMTTSNTGATAFLANSSGHVSRRPDVGGNKFSTGAQVAMIVFERHDTTDPNDTDVWAVELETDTGALGTPYPLHTASNVGPQLAPSITTYGTGSWWGAAWQTELDIAGFGLEDWIFVTAIDPIGIQHTPVAYGSGPGFQSRRPLIDGEQDGRLTVAYTASSSTTLWPRIDLVTLDWPSGPIPTTLRTQTLVSGSFFDPTHLDGLAFDYETGSHWCVLHRWNDAVTATRLGMTGAVLEQDTIPGTNPNVVAGAIAFRESTSTEQGWFPIVFSDDALLDPLWGCGMEYFQAAVTSYGSGCHGGSAARGLRGQPYAGNANWSIRASGMTGNAPAAWLAAFGTAAIPIPDAPGCDLLVDPVTAVPLPATTTPSGSMVLAIELPDDPVFQGDVWFQGVWVDAALNPLGLGVTNGLHVPVR